MLWLLALNACNRSPAEANKQPAEQYVSDPNSVGFDIQPLPGAGNIRAWMATYTSQGKTAKFRIEVRPPKRLDDTDAAGFDCKSGQGKFIAEPGSDAGVLLADLKKALEAKAIHAKARPVSFVPFTFVSFEPNESQVPGGGFALKPRGHWTPMKIFIGEGENEGQVFLNLNPVLKKGQFSIKDPDYGDIIVARLAEVL